MRQGVWGDLLTYNNFSADILNAFEIRKKNWEATRPDAYFYGEC